MRLLTYNICKGGVGRERAIAAVIDASQPDIVILQEATRPAVVARVAKALDIPFWAARPGHSLGFISRLPIATHTWYRPFGSRHAFLEVVPEGKMMRVFGVHLSAVHAAWTERRRMWELGALLAGIRKHQAGFHVLAGDFNTLAPGAQLNARALPLRLRALVMLSGGRIRWRTIDAVLDAGYADAFRVSHPQEEGLTFPVWNPHVRLDYVFVPPAHASRITHCEVVKEAPAARASDHFPLLVEFDSTNDQRPTTNYQLGPRHPADERAGNVFAALDLFQHAVRFEALEDALGRLGRDAEKLLRLVHGKDDRRIAQRCREPGRNHGAPAKIPPFRSRVRHAVTGVQRM